MQQFLLNYIKLTEELTVCFKHFWHIRFLCYRVQEIMDDDQRESGRIPRTVDCELTADLG